MKEIDPYNRYRFKAMICLAPWVDFMFDEVIKNDSKIMNKTIGDFKYEIDGRELTI